MYAINLFHHEIRDCPVILTNLLLLTTQDQINYKGLFEAGLLLLWRVGSNGIRATSPQSWSPGTMVDFNGLITFRGSFGLGTKKRVFASRASFQFSSFSFPLFSHLLSFLRNQTNLFIFHYEAPIFCIFIQNYQSFAIFNVIFIKLLNNFRALWSHILQEKL